jgi:hypothetical protein
VVQKHVIPSRSTQKYFTPTLEVNTKNIPYTISTKKILQVLVVSLKSFVAEKKHVAMQKLFIKERERVLKKWISVRDI